MMYLQRPSGQSQFSVPLEVMSTSRRVDQLRHYISAHLGEPLTVADLADRMHLGEYRARFRAA